MKLKELIGSGDKIILFMLPFVIVGAGLNSVNRRWFSINSSTSLKAVSILSLILGLILWIWSVYLIITQASKNKLITKGPYALMLHPIYTSISLLVLPEIGFILNSWLWTIAGLALYMGRRIYAVREEEELLKTFGNKWKEYKSKVILPWL